VFRKFPGREGVRAAPHDLVVRGGTCFDGRGSAPVVADVAVADGRIVQIGRVTGAARRTLDADGLFVAPGFVDGHTHLDAQVFWDPNGAGLTAQGVTSAVMGNCGFTLAPGSPEQAALVVRSIEHAEEMSPAAIRAGVPWEWTTFPEYLDALDRLPKALHLAAQVGHSAVRVAAMGERAFTDTATDDDLRTMQVMVRAAMEAGSVGFTTSRSSTHTMTDGGPVPSRMATWDEVRSLVLAMAASGRGIFQFAPERPVEPDALSDFRGRLRALALESRRPFTFLVGGQDDQVGTLNEVLAAGGEAVGQVHVRNYQSVFGFATTTPFDRLPSWREPRAEPFAVQAARLRDPELRRRLVAEAENADDAGLVGVGAARHRFDETTVVDGSDPEPSVTAVAAARGVSPVEAMIALTLETDFAQLFRRPLLHVSDDEVLAGLAHPATVVAASDAGAHVARSADSNIPTYLLSHWVRDRGALRWEQAIHMLTGAPARVWGLAGRGVLAVGHHADLVVFDPATVGCGTPSLAHDLPDGGPRITQTATGIRATIVAGEDVVVDGEPTGANPGRLLRAGRASVA
jgi:N-acyl-D-aspartate/D-glutamate deacylase